MNPFLFFGGVFLAAMAIAAVVFRFSSTNARLQSEEERQRERELALRSAERDRQLMQWASAIIFCALAIIAIISWLSHDPSTRQFGFCVAGALALPCLILWAKSRDDGLNPQLRKKPSEPPKPADATSDSTERRST